jgi:cell division protein FtsB
LDFQINILKEENETLEANEVDLTKTVKLLKQNITELNNKLSSQDVEISNKDDELIK